MCFFLLQLVLLSRLLPISFFCSSRRRHTRLVGDWSSDVCSSDLAWLQRLPRFAWTVSIFSFLRTPCSQNTGWFMISTPSGISPHSHSWRKGRGYGLSPDKIKITNQQPTGAFFLGASPALGFRDLR